MPKPKDRIMPTIRPILNREPNNGLSLNGEIYLIYWAATAVYIPMHMPRINLPTKIVGSVVICSKAVETRFSKVTA